METAHKRGAEWRIWDLHVHTPCSIVNGYGGNSDDAWAAFLDDLEALPSDIRVVGINDYWFLDGYKKVLEARGAGRLANLDAVFPVLELRVDQFGGTNSHLRRANAHVIFDPDLDPLVIEQHFINTLSARFSLAAGIDAVTWSGAITRESLEELGRAIKESVPEARRSEYGSDLIEGFNNLNVSMEKVRESLSSTFLLNRWVMGLGKAEWAQIKWNDQAVASKKTLINEAALVFTAYEDPSRWAGDVAQLRDAQVNHRVLDCSDAHALSTSTEPTRLGQCATWINTTPTLAGLKHALAEFERRVFVGLEPPALGRIRRSPDRFIDSIRIRPDGPTTSPTFDYDLPLNPGFVAVVGNKGQGKSALLDCIALAGNSPRNAEFAFLNAQRFLSPSNKRAKEYGAELRWMSNSARRVNLTEGHDKSAPIYVEYLPQQFVERVCSADSESGEADEFERELREVLFTHIPDGERAGEQTFDQLLARKTRASKDRIAQLQADLPPILGRYVALADLRAAEDVADIDARIDLIGKEIERAEAALHEAEAALVEADAQSGSAAERSELRKQADEIAAVKVELNRELEHLDRSAAADSKRLLSLAAVEQQAEDLRRSATLINLEFAELLGDAEVGSQPAVKDDSSAPRPLVAVSIDGALLDELRSSLDERNSTRQDRRRSLTDELVAVEAQSAEVDSALARADSASELARQRLLQCQQRLNALRGTPQDPSSDEGLRALRERVSNAPAAMAQVSDELIEKAHAIHQAYMDQVQEVRDLYRPASQFIANSEVVRGAGLEFDADLRVTTAARAFAQSLDGRKSPELQEWLAQVHENIAGNDWSDVSGMLTRVISDLERERGEAESRFRHPATALRTSASLDDYLTRILDLSWLEVRFGLTGDGLPLSKLSPGQRGLVLVLFYLVVDRRTTPLLLDQPEENLDNATIAHLLVPALHEAAGRRQTVVVTHNANLAVVGDADQVVHCIWQEGQFEVESGCISEFDVAQFTVDILEGTKPAFNRRSDRYAAFPDLR